MCLAQQEEAAIAGLVTVAVKVVPLAVATACTGASGVPAALVGD